MSDLETCEKCLCLHVQEKRLDQDGIFKLKWLEIKGDASAKFQLTAVWQNVLLIKIYMALPLYQKLAY